jgi:hypothetical protein
LKQYVFKYLAEPTETGVIQRPVARIFIKNSDDKWQRFRVYIDSGADMSLLTRNDAEFLGLSLSKGEYHPIIGVGRTLIPAYIHTVKMRIGDTELDVKTAFADSDEVPRLLGRADIFTRFKITFVEQELKIIFET